MFYGIVVGNLGADVKTQEVNGKTFTSGRVAHTERWIDEAGIEHETTQWIDVVWDGRPKVADYLVRGQQILVIGSEKLRVYSSEVERCMKAGARVQAYKTELLGSRPDIVPRQLVAADGHLYPVQKHFHCDAAGEVLNDGRGNEFAVDDNGWVLPLAQAQQMVQAAEAEAQQAAEDSQKSNKKKK